MDDMQMFERRVATEVIRGMGPSEPVDDAAIFAGVTAAPSPKGRVQSMSSALKFVVAGAIVALFGGVLLAGLLTQPGDEQMPAVGASPWATAEAEQAEPTELADRSAGTFASVESLAGAPIGTATVLSDGRVLLVDAIRGEVWDPETGLLSPAGSLGSRRPDHTSVRLTDGRVLIVGGTNPDVPSAEVWDPATASFRPAGSLTEWVPGAYFRPSATLLPDGRVLVTGGGSHHTDSSQMVVVWDPQTATARVAGETMENRAEQTATLLQDGRVLVVGGEVEAGDPGDEICTVCDTPAALAEIWDPVTESFSPAGSLSEGRAGHTATLLQDGRVLIIGGGDTYDHLVRSAEIWDPVTETFSPAGSLREERIFHTATLLPDGRVLVAGGQTLSDLASAAEIWDPDTMSFSPAGSLIRPRRWHSATLLPDGRVLVTGELNAEVWEPTGWQPSADETATAPDLLPGVDLITEEVEDADGTLWAGTPRSVVAFDGNTWTHYLDALQDVTDIGLAPDGSVLANTYHESGPGLHVITPEAVAARQGPRQPPTRPSPDQDPTRHAQRREPS